MNVFVRLAMATAILGTAAPSALGQTAEAPALEDCEVQPLEDGGVMLPNEADPDTGDTLSDALDPCDGVLEPAPVGDREMTIDPPEGGETPIITPEELPPQPPQAE